MARERIATQCMAVSGSIDDLGAEKPQKYRICEPQVLRQSWLETDRVPQERAVAYVGHSPDTLCFYAWLEDTQIYTEARENNEKLWSLGDTVEFFIKPGVNRDDYWEIHVSPNDLIMDLHIPSQRQLNEGTVTWDDIIAPDSGSSKRVRAMAEKDAWALELCVPWSCFDLDGVPAPGTRWQFAVCRYNYPGKREDPELSSTARLTEAGFGKGGFHYSDEYTDLVFK